MAGAKRKSALNFKVLGRRLAPVRNFLVFDNLPFIESAEPRSLDRRDVDKHIFAAARRLNEPISLCRIEPLHGAFRHCLLRIELALTPICYHAGGRAAPALIKRSGFLERRRSGRNRDTGGRNFDLGSTLTELTVELRIVVRIVVDPIVLGVIDANPRATPEQISED